MKKSPENPLVGLDGRIYKTEEASQLGGWHQSTVVIQSANMGGFEKGQVSKGANDPGERKVDEYVQRIRRGESAEGIMKGLSPRFQSAIQERLNAPSTDRRPAEDTAAQLLSFWKTLPQVPVAPGSPLTAIDRSLLPPQTYASLGVGDRVFIRDTGAGNPAIGEIKEKGRAAGVSITLSDDSVLHILPAFAEIYLLSDIERLRNTKK